MYCPNCGAEKTYVNDSRVSQKDRHRVNKRRDCFDCDTKFFTYEVLREDYDTAHDALKFLSNFVKGIKDYV